MRKRIEAVFEDIIFASRWIQAPLYVGLVIALTLYSYKFALELIHLVQNTSSLDETAFMLGVLTLVDITMVSNLIVMTIIGGYSTFVSKIRRYAQKDKPQWIDKMNAGILKVKMGASLIGVSSIHLLQTFIQHLNGVTPVNWDMIWGQILIHSIFVLSTIGLAYIDKLIYPSHSHSEDSNSENLHIEETPVKPTDQ